MSSKVMKRCTTCFNKEASLSWISKQTILDQHKVLFTITKFSFKIGSQEYNCGNVSTNEDSHKPASSFEENQLLTQFMGEDLLAASLPS